MEKRHGTLPSFCTASFFLRLRRTEKREYKNPTDEAENETPLPEWIGKGENGFYYLIPEKIEGFTDAYNGETNVKFASVAKMQDILLHRLPEYENKQDFTALSWGAYQFGYDPRRLWEPILPSDWPYETSGVSMGMSSYYVQYLNSEGYLTAMVKFACKSSPGYYYGYVTGEEGLINQYDDYCQDIFLKPFRSGEITPTGAKVPLTDSIVAEEYGKVNGEKVYLYTVGKDLHVYESENSICVLIEKEDLYIHYTLYEIPENWTREKTLALSAKMIGNTAKE
ncbi:MAG: hypothetical protein E7616_07965 [Ruminococcaceae bacterium]|nr:hypothetical protein [Oscillospiraceae bacterium]